MLVLVGAGAHGPATNRAGAAARRTSLHIFTPFSRGRISADVTVDRTARGYCWTGSISDFARADAWRCFLGNYILDPCFSNGANGTSFVLCPSSPWSSVTKLRLTKRLPRSTGNVKTHNPTVRRPWALELVDGTRCVAVSGATSTIAGLGLDYVCKGGGLLAGLPRRRSPTWTIFYAPGYKATTLSRKAIAEAWW